MHINQQVEIALATLIAVENRVIQATREQYHDLSDASVEAIIKNRIDNVVRLICANSMTEAVNISGPV